MYGRAGWPYAPGMPELDGRVRTLPKRMSVVKVTTSKRIQRSDSVSGPATRLRSKDANRKSKTYQEDRSND